MSRNERSAGRWALPAALLAHALVYAALGPLAPLVAPRSAPAQETQGATTIDIEPAPPPTPRSPGKLEDPVGALSPAALVRPGSARPDLPPARAAESEDPPPDGPAPGPGSAPPAPPPPAPSPTAYGFRPPGWEALGVGGRNPFLPRSAEPEASPLRSAREASARVQSALRQDARARESELGLGPDGPVRDALTRATYQSSAPVSASAVFEITADGAGNVIGITVAGGGANIELYRGIAARARAALSGKPLRLPSGARGAELRIEVTSAWKLPSGADPGTEVELFGQTLKKGEGKQSSKVTLLDPIPRVRCISPDDPKNDMKLPLCGVQLRLFELAADPADIGARPRRIVHTRLVESKIL